MKTPKQRRNRRDAMLLASFIPAAGPDHHLWLTNLAKRLPEAAAQPGWRSVEATAWAGTIRP
jgi:hypothetical protein